MILMRHEITDHKLKITVQTFLFDVMGEKAGRLYYRDDRERYVRATIHEIT